MPERFLARSWGQGTFANTGPRHYPGLRILQARGIYGHSASRDRLAGVPGTPGAENRLTPSWRILFSRGGKR